MKTDLNTILIGIERALAKLKLPAGPDQLINHKTILGFILGTVGAVIGWALTEPYREDFGFWRDFLILASVGCFIWLFVTSLDNFFERSLRAILVGLKRTWFAPLMIVAVVLAAKVAVSGVSSIVTMPSLMPMTAQENLLKVFVLDVSGSMQGDPLATLKKAVRAYLDEVEKNRSKDQIISVACVTFSNDAKLVEGPTTDYRAFLDKVDSIQATGYTNMASGLQLAQTVVAQFLGAPGAAKAPERRKYEIIMLSDGKPNRPEKPGDASYPLTAIHDSLVFYESGMIPINAVGAGNDYDRALMERIAQKTKGRFVAANDIGTLVEVFKELARGGLAQAHSADKDSLPFVWRILGWTFIGLAIGVGSAFSRRSARALFWGMVGGLLGGGIGAIFFEVFQVMTGTMAMSSGVINRLGGFVILGACVGFCVPFVEAVAKTAWLRIIRGLGEGRLIILDRPSMILGRHELIDIPIFGDPQIDLKNLRLQKTGTNLYVETIGPDNLLIRDARTRKGTLAHLDTFTVGNTKFVYLNKREGVTEDKLPDKDRMADRMPRPRAAGTEAARVQAGTPHRRLPIYLVLDASGSMSGAAIKAVNNGLQDFEASVKNDQYASRFACISVIAYGNKVQQMMPLTEAGRFAAPKLKAKGDSSLGQAITLLGQSLIGEVKPATGGHPGDFKPLIFLITAGEPSDAWAGPAENFKTLAAQRSANLIAIGCGAVSARTLKQVGKVALVMPNATPEGIKGIFEWITQSVKAASRSASVQASTGQEGGAAQLPPLPPGVEVAR